MTDAQFMQAIKNFRNSSNALLISEDGLNTQQLTALTGAPVTIVAPDAAVTVITPMQFGRVDVYNQTQYWGNYATMRVVVAIDINGITNEVKLKDGEFLFVRKVVKGLVTENIYLAKLVKKDEYYCGLDPNAY